MPVFLRNVQFLTEYIFLSGQIRGYGSGPHFLSLDQQESLLSL